MAPKSKAKKGKKGDDDEYWAKAGESVPINSLTAGGPLDFEDVVNDKPKGRFSGFAALDMIEAAGEEEEEFDGLMSALKASTKSKKEKTKTKKKDAVSGSLDQGAGSEGEDAAAKDNKSAPQKPMEMTAEDLADEEWGPVKERGKKSKKSKQKGKVSDIEEETKSSPLASAPGLQVDAPADVTADAADQGIEETGTKVLSKKEKEKLKKERDKAKKKAQAAAKKAAEGEDVAKPTPPAPSPIAAPLPPQDEAGQGEGEEGGGTGDSKKKKKKKPAKKDDDSTTVPGPSRNRAAISMLKAIQEAKRAEEEQRQRQEEEERRKEEEEERRRAEEERKREEEKKLRKEKEKAKRELAKKEGRLLTKKQKEDKAKAEMQKQALLASGVHIEGLQQNIAGTGVSAKKVSYGQRKRKGPAARVASPAAESQPRSPEPQLAPPSPKPTEDGLKDDWDASSHDEATKLPDGVKDDWDASSNESDGEKLVEAQVDVAVGNRTPSSLPVPSQTSAILSKFTDGEQEAIAPRSTESSSHPGPSKSKPPPKEDLTESSSSESEEESDGSSSSVSDSDSEDGGKTKIQRLAEQRKIAAAERRAKAHQAALAAGSKDNLRSPICCILGHVDTGKTKLLDKIRQTNVQEGEAGGITQQIGATYFPVDAIQAKTAPLNKDGTQEYKIPGLLIIDTPGHESFTNLRSRGSSLCNIAILVVDIMHGLEPQTLESLRLLRERKTPFIVALNKIDRLYGWVPTPDGAFRESLAKQSRNVQREFEDRVQKTIVLFAEQGLNSVLYYENKNFAKNVSLVPTSAITGEGIPDMIMLLVNLTQQRMSDRLMYLSELECTVLEVKVIEGLGVTIDVVLSNGILREGDKIVLCGLNGPIVTQIRALLTPQPLKELRIKSAYIHHKEVKAALGVKIVAPDLDKAIAGSRLLVVGPDDDEDDLRDEVMSDLTSLLTAIDKTGRGVCVQASTLGSLEALLDFLKASKIPVRFINIGPVHKKDVMHAAIMLEKAKELACILCFDVPVDKDAERLAEEMGIRLFKADIIYHLFDAFTAYNNEIIEAKRKDAAPQAVWPCRLKIIAAFAKRDPIILGVDILDGTLRIGTPLAVVKLDPTTQKKEIIDLGKITSLEINHKPFEIVKKAQAGAGVAVKIEHAVYQSAKMFGRHFDEKDEILSHITRQSIDVLKESFKADVTMEEWHLVKALKSRFNIQ